MKEIKKYVAYDGSEFSRKYDCQRYEKLYRTVQKIMKQLRPKPEDPHCIFANGGGFVTQNPVLVQKVRDELLDVIATRIDHKWIGESKGKERTEVHPSWMAGLLSAYNSSILYAAWTRIWCIDLHGREWGQPYYADHPDEGKQIEYVEPKEEK